MGPRCVRCDRLVEYGAGPLAKGLKRGDREHVSRVPLVVYHGTTARHLPNIMRYGLIPDTKGANWAEVGTDVEGKVFTTDKRKTAQFFAAVAEEPWEEIMHPDDMKYGVVVFTINTARAKLFADTRFQFTTSLRALGAHEWYSASGIPKSAIVGGTWTHYNRQGKIVTDQLSDFELQALADRIREGKAPRGMDEIWNEPSPEAGPVGSAA